MSVTISCFNPETRDEMDKALKLYKEHCDGIREWRPNHRQTVYSFAYWLYRYSGLIQPIKKDNE